MPDSISAPCEVESNYYCIQIVETFEAGRPAHALMLDRLIHSFVILDDPTVLGYGYERAYAELTQAHLTGRQQMNTLFIGGGGYSFPRYVEATYPGASVDVIEIDPAVTATARTRLGLSASSRIRSFNEDARTFLMEWADPQQYDVVFGDAFNDLSIPYHLTTVEFNRIVEKRLKPDGIYLVNVIDKFEDGEFLKAYANGLRAVFPHVYIFGRGTAFQPFDRNTYVLMASRQPLDREFEAVAAIQSEPRSDDAARRGAPERVPEIRPRAHLDRRLRAGGSTAGETVHRARELASLGTPLTDCTCRA